MPESSAILLRYHLTDFARGDDIFTAARQYLPITGMAEGQPAVDSSADADYFPRAAPLVFHYFFAPR